jgi:transglutaminase-like putative cysteine protease
MRCISLQSIIMLCIFISSACFGQSRQVHFGDHPKWVIPQSFDKNALPDESQRSSWYYLMVDMQENVLTQESYYHYAYVILSTQGIQEMSDLTFNFDPTYQTMIVNDVSIHRDGTTMVNLGKDIRTVQREESMDRYLYDGTHTAIVNLKDVRKGDVVEFSYTIKGVNPVFAGHVSRALYFDFGSAYENLFLRILLPDDKKFFFKDLSDSTVHAIRRNANGIATYEWHLKHQNMLTTDAGVPGWYDPSRRTIVSDFASWNDVAMWASEVFKVSEEDEKRLANKIAQTFKEGDQEAYALEAIRFVQDEVRYLGFETGLNSHKPHSPLKVFEQRYGDCKDKSNLLVTLLRARGIVAYPMLVSTTLKEMLDERLPAANVFDHCVVSLDLNGSTIYVDPTISNQGGKVGEISFPDYRRGLIVNNTTSKLTDLRRPSASSISENQTLEVKSFDDAAILSIRTTYMGAEADYQRSYFSSTSLDEIQNHYLEYSSRIYPNLEKLENLKLSDNRNDNVLSVEEKYKIPELWKPLESNPNLIYFEVYAQTLEGYFNITKSTGRQTPFSLTYPLDYHHVTEVILPEEWPLKSDYVEINNNAYAYEYSITTKGNTFLRSVHYKTESDHISSKDFKSFLDDHKKMMNNLNYSFSYNKDVAKANESIWPGMLVTILSIIGAVYLVFAVYHLYNPPGKHSLNERIPIGGWLILLGMGLVFSPIVILKDITGVPDLVLGRGWLGLLASGEYMTSIGLFFIHVYNFIHLAFSGLLVVLFFKGRTSFPRLLVIFLTGQVVLVTLDVLIATAIDAPPTEYNSLIRAVVVACVWIPYMLYSDRVKETFVVRLPDDDNNSHELVVQDENLENLR